MTRAAALAMALLSAWSLPVAAETIDAAWSKAAKSAAVMRAKQGRGGMTLPEVRLYDARGRLLLTAGSGNLIPKIEAAMRQPRPVSGQTLNTALDELTLADGAPVRLAKQRTRRFVLVDYWAEWCVPCKLVSKQLDNWLARQPAGSVTLVRAETDIVQAMRESGAAVKIVKTMGEAGK